MSHSVSSVGCRVVVAACEQLGFDTAEMLRAHGLVRDQVEDPDGRLASDAVRGLWQDAVRRSGDAHFALRVAESIPAGAYRVLEYVIASASTVGTAFSKVGEYFAWVDTSVRLPVGPHALGFSLGIEADAPPERVPLRALEFTFATSLLKVRALTRQAFAPVCVQAACEAPVERARLERFFGCEWQFQSGHNRMCFAADTWALPSRSADATLLGVLELHAQQLIAALEREPALVAEVRHVLYKSGPNLSVAAAAKLLGVSSRTLQRRLTEAGHVFADIADTVREDLARRMLSERNVAIAEAAYLLGFADQSSFTRAFKRWTGLTPAAYRESPRTL